MRPPAITAPETSTRPPLLLTPQAAVQVRLLEQVMGSQRRALLGWQQYLEHRRQRRLHKARRQGRGWGAFRLGVALRAWLAPFCASCSLPCAAPLRCRAAPPLVPAGGGLPAPSARAAQPLAPRSGREPGGADCHASGRAHQPRAPAAPRLARLARCAGGAAAGGCRPGTGGEPPPRQAAGQGLGELGRVDGGVPRHGPAPRGAPAGHSAGGLAPSRQERRQEVGRAGWQERASSCCTAD